MRLALVVAAGTVVVGVMSLNCWWAKRSAESPQVLLDPANVIVVRTPGGMLEAATLVRNEEFGWTSKHACFLIDCGALLGATTTRIRLPVHYTYRLPLQANWSLNLQQGEYVLDVPAEQPQVPVAADFSKIEIETSRGWLSPSTTANRERLLRELQPELGRRAVLPQYVDAQRAQARKTVVEFAHKWMRDQGISASAPIRVRFADEGHGGR